METAWLEAQQGFAFKPQPLTICAYDVDSDPILDLTDPNNLKPLSVAMAEFSLSLGTARRARRDAADLDPGPQAHCRGGQRSACTELCPWRDVGGRQCRVLAMVRRSTQPGRVD